MEAATPELGLPIVELGDRPPNNKIGRDFTGLGAAAYGSQRDYSAYSRMLQHHLRLACPYEFEPPFSGIQSGSALA